MYLELKENKPHGTKYYPFTQYFIHKPRNAFHIPVHWHEEVEIIYMQRGVLTITIQEEVFQAKAGDLFFVNSGELHFMESEDMTVEYYTMLFPLEFISFRTEDALEEEVLLPLRQKKLLLPICIQKEDIKYEIIELLKQIIRINMEKQTGYMLRTRILLLEIMEQILISDSFYQAVFVNVENLQRDMLAYIQRHYTEKITLGMLAEEFHLSEKYISSYFKEHFSISFMQYVTHLRMTKAKNLLVTTELPITEVALSCGFLSVNLFIRTFKAAYQVTPLQYRKKMIT